ncbi:PF20097 family protein [Succiniclasticum ruminis]|jgi:hypothetical protein|uniref:PF20097 family protein n=1 Tax=Succiniclasticum ruminis TaxID=40841 RepID=UPI0035265442
MNCPYCNKKMISGFVQGGREVFFTEQKHKWIFAATDKDVLLTRHNLTAPTCKAYHCPTCKKVLIDYASDCE